MVRFSIEADSVLELYEDLVNACSAFGIADFYKKGELSENMITQQVQQPIQQPVQQPIQQPVPTVKASYNLQQLAVAAMQLKDQGRLHELQNLLVKYNVQAMTMLSEEDLEPFAQDLISLGVKL